MTNEAFYKRMKAFDSFYYCVFDSTHPREILNLDNNLELAFYMRDGMNKKELRNIGIDFKQSQITLLKSYNLIYEDKGTYYSNILFFPEYEAKMLRDCADDFAVRIAASVSGEIKNLLKILDKKGIKNNAYSILFSYILDGLVWENLISRCKLMNMKLDKDNPLWNGLIWMVEPKRKGTLRTVCGQSGNSAVCCTTSSAFPKLKPDSEFFTRIANDFRVHDKVVDKELIQLLIKAGLYSENEGLLIPVIKNDLKDVIFRTSKLISVHIADYLCDNLSVFAKLSFPKGLEEWKQMIVVYHEIMWSIMNILIQAGEIDRGDIFYDKNDTCIRDISYIVIR